MNNEKKIILFTFVAHFLFHFYEIAFPVLAIPLMLSLKMDLKGVLELGFPMYLLFGLSSLPWGYFADRFSNRRALMICFFGGSLGAFLTAFSSSGTSFMLSLAVIGIFACICHPAGMGLISHGVRNRGMALGINSVAGSIGLIVGPFLAGLLNWLAGWQMAYLTIGIFSLLWGIAIIFVKIDETPIEGLDIPEPTSTNRRTNHWLRVLLFFLIVTLGGLAYRINIVVLPAYLEFNATFLSRFFLGLNLPNMAATTTMAASLLASFVYLIGIVGQLAGGKMADQYDLRWLYLAFNVISLPCVILMGFLTEQPLVMAAAAYVFFALGIQPIENSLIAKFTPRKWRSTGYGISSVLIFGVGALAVYLVGWVKDQWYLGAIYLVSGGFIALIILGIMVLLRLTQGSPYKNKAASTALCHER
jgi:MFS family permease